MSVLRAIAYAGYPGAGKTEAATFGEQWIGGEHVSMGDVVKEIAYDKLGEDATSHEIGHWATVSRYVGGPAVMANRVIEWWDEHGYPEEPVHIEGIRAIEELYVFEVVFGYIPVIFVDAGPDIRLQRLQQRGRDGEDRFGKVDLIERDIREAKWGLRKLEHLSDHPVENDLDYETLNNRIGMKLVVLGYDLQ